jgi:hypothetical protein
MNTLPELSLKLSLKPFLKTIVHCTVAAFVLVGVTAQHLNAQVATTLQIIHNAPEPSLSPISVWAGITAPPATTATFAPVAPNISFRGATAAFSGFPPLLPSLDILRALPPLQANLTRITSTNGSYKQSRCRSGIQCRTRRIKTNGTSRHIRSTSPPPNRNRSRTLIVIAGIRTEGDRLCFLSG